MTDLDQISKELNPFDKPVDKPDNSVRDVIETPSDRPAASRELAHTRMGVSHALSDEMVAMAHHPESMLMNAWEKMIVTLSREAFNNKRFILMDTVTFTRRRDHQRFREVLDIMCDTVPLAFDNQNDQYNQATIMVMMDRFHALAGAERLVK
jgi:hypothetical protein